MQLWYKEFLSCAAGSSADLYLPRHFFCWQFSRPAPDSCALPFSDMDRTRVNISLGVSLFHIYNSQPNFVSQFVCAKLLHNSGGPSPPSLAGSWLRLSCAPQHHSATDSTRRRGTAALLVGVTCLVQVLSLCLKSTCVLVPVRVRVRVRVHQPEVLSFAGTSPVPHVYPRLCIYVYRYTYLKYCPLQVLPLYLTCTRVCVLVFAHIPGGHQPHCCGAPPCRWGAGTRFW